MQQIKKQIKDYTLHNRTELQLSEEQNEIVDKLLQNNYFFNCSQTGYGKTITTITAAVYKYVEILNKENKKADFIIVCPTIATGAFRKALNDILGVPFSIYTAQTKRVNNNANFHVFNYSSLTQDLVKKKKTVKGQTFVEWEDNLKGRNEYLSTFINIVENSEYPVLILDEAHALQDSSSNQYIIMQQLVSVFKIIWAMTATPILNDLGGFYNMVNIIIPNYFGNIFRFRNKYLRIENKDIWTYNKRKRKSEKITVQEVVGTKNQEELRKEFDLISVIKAKQYNLEFIYREVELSEQDRVLYKTTADRLNKSKETASAILHDLQRVVSNTLDNTDTNTISNKELQTFKDAVEIINRDESVLIYFTYLDTLDRVETILKKLQKDLGIKRISRITGAVDAKTRQQISKTLDRREVVLITSAGTESIDLQMANNIIFHEIPFPVKEFIQAIGRITRVNTIHDIQRVYLPEAVGTIDTYKRKRIEKNINIIKSVVGGGNTLPIETIDLYIEDRDTMKDKYLWCRYGF